MRIMRGVHLSWISLLVVVLVFALCQTDGSQQRQDQLLVQEISKGEYLAKKHCATCHTFTPAEILPTKYWGNLLPMMGFFLGAGKEKYQFADYNNPIAKSRLLESGLFPQNPLISTEDWIAINIYYLKKSPETLDVKDENEPLGTTQQFEMHPLPWKDSGEGLSYLEYAHPHVMAGVYRDQSSYAVKITADGREFNRLPLPTALVDRALTNSSEQLLLMGKLNNIDEPTGSFGAVRNKKYERILDSLERPINFENYDFDNDGVEDILIAEFGKFLGGIYLYQHSDRNQKKVLHAQPGAVKLILRDFNQDGLMDFYALVTQAEERIYRFTNQGDLPFKKEVIVELPPYYGTTHFEMVDIDGDGDEDVICSSGDSGDYGIIYKPFHGVRIFENKGTTHFEEVWFHSQQGAYGTQTVDFDQDGDLDIASIGYFAAHLGHNEDSFIYFENQSTPDSSWNFKSTSLDDAKDDCWILMESADVDQDGDVDIILGGNSKVLKSEQQQAKSTQWEEEGGMVTILKNTLY